MRKLASIQKVLAVAPIQGADAIERVDILGWQCVSKKGEFKPNDLVVYLEIDSLLPRAPWCEFLFKPGRDDASAVYRLRTVKLRGQVSQGLVLPLSVLDGKKFSSDVRENPAYTWSEGQEVTELLGVTKFEPTIPAQLAGQVKGQFPSFIPKTDETRVQAEPGVIEEFKGKQVVITTKMDGSSGTFFFYEGEFGVCSRNLEFKEDGDNSFWKVANKYGLKEKLAKLGRNIAIQAELCGPSIQKNRLNLKEHDIYAFNVYDIQAARYLDADQASDVIQDLGLKPVPVEYTGIFDPSWDLPKLLSMAKGLYTGTNNHKEGIVIRPLVEERSEALKGRASFKVINNDYLLKGEE